MSESRPSEEKGPGMPGMIRTIRLVKIAVAATLVLLSCAVVPTWVRAVLTDPQIGRIRLGFLIALHSGYLAVLAIALLGLVVLGWLCWRQWRSPSRRVHPALARGLISCMAILTALGLAEITAAIWLRWTHRVPVLPVSIPAEPESTPNLPTRLGSDEHGAVLIVVVGESSAEGVPYREYLSVGEIVAWQLRKAIPGRTFRVENQAQSGTRLEQMHQKLATLTHRPDAIIVYAGHNEFYARHGWTDEVSPYYVEGPIVYAPPFKKIAERFSPLVRMIDEAIDQELVARSPPRVVRRLIDAPSHTAQEHAELLADFRSRMEAIVSYCQQIGALPILVAPPGNDAGFEPNRSILPPETPRAQREAFASAFEKARALEKTDPAGSIAAYRGLIERYPGFAESHFRLARLLEASGEYEEAYRQYIEARDLDGHPFRCLTSFQDVYREMASKYKAILIDGQAVFHDRHPHGMLDDYLFNDGFHPSLEGHVALAEAILAALRARRAFGWPEAVPAPRIDLTECAAHFGVGTKAWKAVCNFARSFYELTAQLRHDPSERNTKKERYYNAMKLLDYGRDADSLDLPGVGCRPVRLRIKRLAP